MTAAHAAGPGPVDAKLGSAGGHSDTTGYSSSDFVAGSTASSGGGDSGRELLDEGAYPTSSVATGPLEDGELDESVEDLAPDSNDGGDPEEGARVRGDVLLLPQPQPQPGQREEEEVNSLPYCSTRPFAMSGSSPLAGRSSGGIGVSATERAERLLASMDDQQTTATAAAAPSSSAAATVSGNGAPSSTDEERIPQWIREAAAAASGVAAEEEEEEAAEGGGLGPRCRWYECVRPAVLRRTASIESERVGRLVRPLPAASPPALPCPAVHRLTLQVGVI
eukprot:COSAG01_NODE_15188_length_1363_cov_6.749209_2_plen_279_part_00